MGTIITESNHGGGLHGRMTMELKQAFYNEVKNQLDDQGRPDLAENLDYQDLFHLSAGTSFGALSTAGMSRIKGRGAYFKSPAELGDFIDRTASTIFPHHDSFLGKLFQHPRQILGGIAGTTRYSQAPLRDAIQGIVGKDTTMADVEDDIMLTMTRVHPNLDAMFAKSHVARGEVTEIDDLDDAKRKDWLLWQAALGSASPTTYLPGVELTNPFRDDRVVVIDGGQSGWNNPSIPAIAEATFIYGSETEDRDQCLIMNTRSHQMYGLPHDIIHIHWGTGDYDAGVSLKDAKKNSLLSMKDVLVASSMQSVHKYSLRQGARQIDHFYNFDVLIDDVPEEIRPDENFVLSTDDQMNRLRETGLYAAEKLSSQIQEAATLVAKAYIERAEYEAAHPDHSYKDFLKGEVPSMS
ncbi:MAG: hypothetical protein ACTHOO_09395 [Alcanivorax sp.]